MKARSVELFVLVVYLAMVFTLVRPGSQGPALVSAVGSALAGIMSAAVGSGGWGSAGGAPGGTSGSTSGGTLYA